MEQTASLIAPVMPLTFGVALCVPPDESGPDVALFALACSGSALALVVRPLARGVDPQPTIQLRLGRPLPCASAFLFALATATGTRHRRAGEIDGARWSGGYSG